MIDQSVEALIGATPALELTRIGRPFSAKILVKIEGKNPFGSVKDRVAKAMLDDAEQKGLLKPGGVIIEPTSAIPGIALCALAAARGYKGHHCHAGYDVKRAHQPDEGLWRPPSS